MKVDKRARRLVLVVVVAVTSACSGSKPSRAGVHNPTGATATAAPTAGSTTSVAPGSSTSRPEVTAPVFPGRVPTEVVGVPAAPAPGRWADEVADVKMLTDTEGWTVGYGCPGCQVPLDMTTDGGASWRRVASPVAAAGADTVFALSVGQGPQLWLWSRADNNSLGSALFRSLDGGRSWSQIRGLGGIESLSVEPGAVWAVEQKCPLDGATACTERLLTTTDGGSTWVAPSAQPGLPPGADGVDLVRIDALHAWVLSTRIAGGFTLGSTTDGGASWTSEPPPPQGCFGDPFDLAAADTVHLWLGCGGNGATIMERREIAVSDDGGRTWTVTQDATVTGHLADVAVATPTTGFVGQCRGPLLESRDQGRTWVAATPNAPLDGCVNALEFLDPTHGWAAGQTAAGTWIIWRTADCGVTWSYATPS